MKKSLFDALTSLDKLDVCEEKGSKKISGDFISDYETAKDFLIRFNGNCNLGSIIASYDEKNNILDIMFGSGGDIDKRILIWGDRSYCKYIAKR